MVIDTPPGTSDEHLSIVQYLSEADVDGAIIVTTPQVSDLLLFSTQLYYYMSCVARKPVCGVYDQVRLKPGCTATEDG